MRRERSLIRLFTAVLAASLLLWVVPALGQEGEDPRYEDKLARGGLSGWKGTMEAVNLPAKVSRIQIVPDTAGQEAWAIGHLTGSGEPGWDSGPTGQLVFLHYAGGRWQVHGPPVDAGGAVIDPEITGWSFASKDEAWAVGLHGTILRWQRGLAEGRWVQHPCPVNPCDLLAVSVKQGEGGAYGYAVGAGGLRLRLSQGPEGPVWTSENSLLLDPTDESSATEPPRLTGVAVVSEEEVWAVGGSRHLKLFERHADGVTTVWERRLTTNPLFDQEFPLTGDASGLGFGAVGYAAVATSDGGAVWFSGGFQPLDPDPSAQESETRPFAVRWEPDTQSFTTYCPVVYMLDEAGSNSGAAVETGNMCDKRMPLGPGILSALSAVPGGEEMWAGGTGLLHFKDGEWWREPDLAGYLGSVSFVASDQGWVAPSSAPGAFVARSESTTVGHFTPKAADNTRVARWPQSNRLTLESVEFGPGGDALAVGQRSVGVHYRPGAGWDRVQNASPLYGIRAGRPNHLHDVAWSAESEAWAVGEFGAILRFDGTTLAEVPASQYYDSGETLALYAVAFVSPQLGYAVGAGGTILVYENGVWSKDPLSGVVTTKTLYDLVAAGGSLAAVGEDSTLLLNLSGLPGQWGSSGAVRDALGGRKSNLYSIKALPDGTLLVGGSGQALLARDPGPNRPFKSFADRMEGLQTFLAVDGMRDETGTIHAFVSATSESVKYVGNELRARHGSLLHWDGLRWGNLDRPASVKIHERSDEPFEREPAYSIDVDPAGQPRGWAAGGNPAGPTSSLYRFDLEGGPNPPDAEIAWDALKSIWKIPDDGFSFVFFAESRCGPHDDSAPVQDCNLAVGSGNVADEVPLAIQRQVNDLTGSVDWGPEFVLYGGGMRLRGIPEELAELDGYLGNFAKPVFGAIGSRDLFSPAMVNSQGIEQFLPGFLSSFLPDQQIQVAPVNGFFLNQFATKPKPWGNGASLESLGFDPVNTGLPADDERARTHYAFDYKHGGGAVLRVVVLDTSDRVFSVGKNLETQNPRGQDQAGWLAAVAGDAATKNIPVIVVSNVPSANPLTAGNIPPNYDHGGVLNDWPTFEGQIQALDIKAVLSGFIRGNGRYSIGQPPADVPVYVMGSGGAPPGGNQYPANGHYHAWGMVTIDPDGAKNALGQAEAKVTVRAIPVIESLALDALAGLEAAGGNSLKFEALARAIDGGGPDDPKYARRTYLRFPLSEAFEHRVITGEDSPTINKLAIRPDYHFVSENPEIADFVVPDLSKDNAPLLYEGIKGNVVRDDQSGLLCTFKAGTTNIMVVSANKVVRMPITVTGGDGPCVPSPVPPAPVVPEEAPPAVQPEAPVVTVKSPPKPAPPSPPQPPVPSVPAPVYRPWYQQIPNNIPVFIFPPAPGPVVAPAPPASPAGAAGAKKEEEKEASHEKAGEGEFRAIPWEETGNRHEPHAGWLMMAAASLLGMTGAMAAGSVKARRKSVLNPIRLHR